MIIVMEVAKNPIPPFSSQDRMRGKKLFCPVLFHL
jgi:hypothetical protein